MVKEIPMAKVLNRRFINETFLNTKSGGYPLLSNYTESYNYPNIKESIIRWKEYSPIKESSIDKMLELFEIVSEKGSVKEINECTELVIGNVCSLKETSDIQSRLRLIKNTEPILDSLQESIICDNIIKTHEDISKRFNIDDYVQRNHGFGLNECVYKICEFIDTYNMGINTKYKICLNESQYVLLKNGIDYTNGKIVEYVTDYFLFNHLDQNDWNGELLNIMETVIAENNFIHDTEYIDRLKNAILEYDGITINTESYDDILTKDSTSMDSIIIKESKALDIFKASPNKNIGTLKNTITKMLSVKDEDDIINETNSVLTLTFYFFVVIGAMAISFWAGIVALIVSIICSNLSTKENTKKVLKVWHSKRANAAKRLEKESDPTKKEKLQKYLDGLDKGVSRIEDHYDMIKADEEKFADELRPKNYNGSKSSKSDDFDFNLGFDEYNTEDFKNIGILIDGISNISWNNYVAEQTLLRKDTLLSLQLEDVEYITEFAHKYPDMLSNKGLNRVLTECVRILRKNPCLENYIKIDIMNQCRALLAEETTESEDKSLDQIYDELDEVYRYTESINQVINELSAGNTIRLAIDKLEKGIGDLNVKQQIISRSVDSMANRIQKHVDSAFTLEARAAVVRGDILPSMSKCIKYILAAGALFLIHPYLAIVGIGASLSKRSTEMSKERQMFADELDVEIHMVDKYINKAEEKGDLKRVKELMLLKKKLQSHFARIKYGLRYNYDKTVSNSAIPGNE